MVGTGTGRETVQFAYGYGQPLKVYYASSVNYVLWGKMFRNLYEILRNPLSGAHDISFTETAAVLAAKGQKTRLGDLGTDYERQAVAFVRFGWSGADPSSTALPLKPNPRNVASSSRFKWKWIGLHEDYQ
jgi:hypothetical protein